LIGASRDGKDEQMSMRLQGLLIIGLLLILSLIFQVQMKLFANEIAPMLAAANQSLLSKAHRLLAATMGLRPLFIVLLAGLLFLIWLLTLTQLELSLALPLASIALVINALGGGLLLGETMSLTRVLGIAAIALGITLVLST
jgi:uncharacterized membrane protein